MGDFGFPDYNMGNFAGQLDLNGGDSAYGDDPSLDPADVAENYLFPEPESEKERAERELEEWLRHIAEGGSL